MSKKPHPLKGRKRTPEAIRKMVEGKRRARLARENGTAEAVPLEVSVRDCLVFLNTALGHLKKEPQHQTKITASELYLRLAIETLRGAV